MMLIMGVCWGLSARVLTFAKNWGTSGKVQFFGYFKLFGSSDIGKHSLLGQHEGKDERARSSHLSRDSEFNVTFSVVSYMSLLTFHVVRKSVSHLQK